MSIDSKVVPFTPRVTPSVAEVEFAAARLATAAIKIAGELFTRKTCFNLTTSEHALELLEAAKMQIEAGRNALIT